MEPAPLAAGEQLAGEVEGVEPRVAERRGPEPEVDPRQRDVVLHRLAALLAEQLGERQVAQRRDRRVGRDRPEVLVGPRADLRAIAVAHDREHRVVGRVVGREERADVLERGRVEVGHRADRRVVVRMGLREQVGEELLVPRPVRPVVVAPALLVLDDLALVVEVVLAERVEEAAEAVRLEPDRQLQLVRRQGLVVVRPVEPGRPVEGPAGGLDERHVLGLPDVRRALEHHVLEEVGEAGLALDLVLGADVVPDVDGDDGREVVLGDDQAQAVGQALVAEADDGDGHAERILGRRWVSPDCRPGPRESRPGRRRREGQSAKSNDFMRSRSTTATPAARSAESQMLVSASSLHDAHRGTSRRSRPR